MALSFGLHRMIAQWIENGTRDPMLVLLVSAVLMGAADGIGNPLRGARLGGLKKQLGCGLRKHGLGILAVAFFKLAAPLKTHYNRVPILAVFRDGGVELRQLVEACQLVQHKPYRQHER